MRVDPFFKSKNRMGQANHKKQILVICSRNKWRSKTAETIFKNHPEVHVKSAGTSKNAVKKVNQILIDWAESVFVMEKKHQEILLKNFSINPSKIFILEIPDIYKYMDEELIDQLKDSIYVSKNTH